MSTAVASPPPPGAPSGGLALSLLGHPVVTVDGLVRPLRYGKSKALLAYLALQPLPVVRRTAAALFWESLPPDRAKANLRVILHDLRTCLGPYLWVDRTTIALDRTRLRTDVGRLEVAIAEARSPGSGDVLVDLLAAGSGDFLEGVELRDAPEAEAFVRLQRERIRRLTTDALIAALGSGDRSPGAGGPTLDEAQAAALISRLGLLEPWNEEGRRAVMGTYVRSGHPASALAIYREFRDGLHHGFGLVPEPATAALAASIAEASGIPLTSPGDRPTSPVTAPLFGRREEVETVCRALADGHRLVTVTGPGGVGKSRLALEVAGRSRLGVDPELPSGVVVVELADSSPTTDRAVDLATATAGALGLPLAGYRDPTVELVSILRDRRLLLVLDNGEAVIAPLGGFVESLLAACTGIQVLLTSRIPLRARAERALTLGPLPVPGPGADGPAVAESPSVQLVLARARAIGAPVAAEDVPTVAALCREVGGLPLALELVAMQLRLFTPGELVGHLPGTPDELPDDASDRPRRHRTIRSSIRWSYDLLGDAEQKLFRTLGIFRGGAAIGAVAGIIPPGGWPSVARLVDAGLVQRVDGPGGTRLTMSAAIRSFALDRLEAAGELDEAARRHAQVHLDFAAQADHSLRGPDQAEWLARLESEHDNLHGALTTLVESGDTAGALHLAVALTWFWQLRGHGEVAAHWLGRATSLPVLPGHPELDALRADAHLRSAMVAVRAHREQSAVDQLQLARRQVDRLGDPALRAELLFVEVNLAARFAPTPEGGALADRMEEVVALAREHRSTWDVARYREYQAWMALADGDFPRARTMADAARRGYQSSGDALGVAATVIVTASVDGLEGRASEALPRMEAAYRTLRDLGDITSCLYALACGAAGATLTGDDAAAARLFGALDVELDRTGMVMPVMAATLHAEFQHLCRTRLEPSTWRTSWEAGRQAGLRVGWPTG